MTRASYDEPVPAVCTVKDVCRHLGISRSTFERKYLRHELPLVPVELGRTGRGCMRRFTGQSVQAIKAGRWGHPAMQVSA